MKTTGRRKRGKIKGKFKLEKQIYPERAKNKDKKGASGLIP